MKILVIGSGGREHALAWKLAQSPRVAEVIVAGQRRHRTEAKCRNAAVKRPISPACWRWRSAKACADRGRAGRAAGGGRGGPLPRRRAAHLPGRPPPPAQLEGSKAFAKDFLARHGIPTAFYAVHTDVDAALAYVRAASIKSGGAPIVIKADGLAAGKGVIVAMTLAEAEAAVRDMLSGNAFGDAGARVVIEEFLDGEEASFISMVDGKTALPLATSQDHKRVGDGDTGPNTGGMGAYSPAPVCAGPRADHARGGGTDRGGAATACHHRLLYAADIDASGAPKVIEFNAWRSGNPADRCGWPRFSTFRRARGLDAGGAGVRALRSAWWPRGPSEAPVTGEVISGLDAVPAQAKVFHAGTALDAGAG